MSDRVGRMDRVDGGITYTVVVNDEEQYAIWPGTRDPPAGWGEAGRRGSRDECLAYVEHVWTDMRPLSVRRRDEQTRDR
jgi:MbtH protein